MTSWLQNTRKKLNISSYTRQFASCDRTRDLFARDSTNHLYAYGGVNFKDNEKLQYACRVFAEELFGHLYDKYHSWTQAAEIAHDKKAQECCAEWVAKLQLPNYGVTPNKGKTGGTEFDVPTPKEALGIVNTVIGTCIKIYSRNNQPFLSFLPNKVFVMNYSIFEDTVGRQETMQIKHDNPMLTQSSANFRLGRNTHTLKQVNIMKPEAISWKEFSSRTRKRWDSFEERDSSMQVMADQEKSRMR